ncbi:MAG: hypoxanthine phosphoribosyltransferase [Clostridia bacterium]|nr:hypoxanthine phosphoribosyltransferase [Clostridia bacterium]
MLNDIERILISEEELDAKTSELASEISEDFKGEELIVIGILKGGVVFAADIIKKISIPMEIEFMAVSSYGKESETSGVVTLKKDIDTSIAGKNVIVVEDIVDSGYTMKYLTKLLLDRHAKSVKICTLLSKPSRRKVEIDLDYVGFEVPDEFVVGYGLDFDEKYRNLPFVGVLKREVYSK